MNVTCPNCATIYRIDPAKVPEAGVRARCAVCNAVFAVRREDEAARTNAPPAAVPTPFQSPIPTRVEPAKPEPPRAQPVIAEALRTEPPRPKPPTPEPPSPQPARAAQVPNEPARMSDAPAAASPPPPTKEAIPSRPATPSRPANPFTRPAVSPSSVPAAAAPPAAPAVPAAPARPTVPPAAAQAPAPAAPKSSSPGSAQPAPAPRPTPPAGARPANPFLSQDPTLKARRLARALISDMVVYHPGKRQEGLRDGNLKELFEEEIKKSWEEYAEQVGRDVAESTTYFREALNEILAGGRQIF